MEERGKMEEWFIEVRLKVPKPLYDFLLMIEGSEEAVIRYMREAIEDGINADFDRLREGGPMGEKLYNRFKETLDLLL